MNKKALSLCLAVACVFLVAASCEVSTANLTDVVTCSQSENLQCVSEQTGFSTTTPVIYVTAVLNNAPEGTEVTANWSYLGGETDPTFIDSASVESSETTSDLEFSLTKPTNDWPKGDYEVELVVSAQNVEPVAKQFKVE